MRSQRCTTSDLDQYVIWLDFTDDGNEEPWFTLSYKDALETEMMHRNGCVILAGFDAPDFMSAMKKFEEIVAHEMDYQLPLAANE